MSSNVILDGKLVFPANYLSAMDLIAAKRDEITATISAVEFEELTMEGGKKDTKAIITFAGMKKKFILSAKANAKAISKLYGTVMNDWVGKRITIYHTVTNVGREKDVPCLRVRPVVPAAKQAQQAQTENK